jgi:hypothetical protein
MTIRNNTPKASQRRHFINRRCSEAQPTDIATIPPQAPHGAIQYKVSSLQDLARRTFDVRRLRFATPTVNEILSLQDKWDLKFRGIIADSHFNN